MQNKIITLFTLCLPLCAFAQSFEQKVQRYFKAFDSAQEKIVERYESNPDKLPELITRDELESWVQVPKSYRLSAGQIQKLIQDQNSRAQQAAALAKENSILSLNRLRNMGETQIQNFCQQIPKGGMLHVHAWGTAKEETLKKILQNTDPLINPSEYLKKFSSSHPQSKLSEDIFSTDEIEYFDRLNKNTQYLDLDPTTEVTPFINLFVLDDKSVSSFDRFMAVFGLYGMAKFYHPDKVDENQNILWRDLLERSRKLGISYLEVSISFFAPWGLDEKITKLNQLAIMARQEYGIEVRYLAGFLRQNDNISKNWKLAKTLYQKIENQAFFVGINLQADETNNSALRKGQAIYAPLLVLKKSGNSRLQATMHAGELGHFDNVRDAIILGSQRIGHGNLVVNRPIALEYAIKKKIAIETNLISNIRLGIEPSIEEHPFIKFLRLGLRVSLSTDDEGIFKTDMAHECYQAIEKTDIQYSELKQMFLNSIETAFVEAAAKATLKSQLLADLENFEKDWLNRLTPP